MVEQTKKHHKGGDANTGGASVSNVVAKMFACCLLALMLQTMVALFPSFVVNKVSKENKAVGADDPHHNHRVQGTQGDKGIPVLDEATIPIVCAHRGVNDANKTVNSTGAALLNLCMKHDLCCGDYDVSSTNDGVLVVGTPNDLKLLFASAGRSVEGGSDPQVRDYTWKDIQEKDPSEKYFTELRTIVDVAVALKGNGKDLLLTLEPKASTERLRRTLVGRMVPLIQGQHSDMFAVIARSSKEVPLPLKHLAEKYVSNHSLWVNMSAPTVSSVANLPRHRLEHTQDGLAPSPTTSETHDGEHGTENKKEVDKTVHFAVALRDRQLDEVISTLRSIRAAKKKKAGEQLRPHQSPQRSILDPSHGSNRTDQSAEHAASSLEDLQALERKQMKRALLQCSLLCPARGPRWARYIMPSNKFVKMCSQLRHTAMSDFGLEFYKKWFGKCLKVRGLHHAQHIVWVMDEQADFSVLPPKYRPAFVVSNKPVEVRDKLNFREITL